MAELHLPLSTTGDALLFPADLFYCREATEALVTFLLLCDSEGVRAELTNDTPSEVRGVF